MKGLRTKLRECRALVARGKLREADAIFQEIEDGLDIDHNLKQAKNEMRKARSHAPDPRINPPNPASANLRDFGD